MLEFLLVLKQKAKNINNINNLNKQIQIFISSKDLFSAYTSLNLKCFSWSFSTQQSISSECVCGVQLQALVQKVLWGKHVLTSTLNKPRKISYSFHITKVGTLWSLDINLFGEGVETNIRVTLIYHCFCIMGNLFDVLVTNQFFSTLSSYFDLFVPHTNLYYFNFEIFLGLV